MLRTCLGNGHKLADGIRTIVAPVAGSAVSTALAASEGIAVYTNDINDPGQFGLCKTPGAIQPLGMV